MAQEKQQYEELTTRQQAFVDTVAELKAKNMEITNEKIREGMEKQGVETYAESTHTTYIGLYDHIIEERKQMAANERCDHDGDEFVEAGEDGEPVIDATMTHLAEREYEGAEQGGEREEVDRTVSLDMNLNLAFRLIYSAERTPARQLFEMVVQDLNERENHDQ